MKKNIEYQTWVNTYEFASFKTEITRWNIIFLRDNTFSNSMDQQSNSCRGRCFSVKIPVKKRKEHLVFVQNGTR